MNILFFSENFPPETNAAATRVYERACYWVKWGHTVTVITTAPNFPRGRLFAGYRNHWYRTETLSGIRVVRVKTFIAANEGVFWRAVDFLSFLFTGFLAGLVQKRPDVIAATSPQFFAAVAAWAVAGVRRAPFVFELGDLWPASISAVGAMRGGFFLRAMEKMELHLYRRAAVVVALTGAFKTNLVKRKIPAGKIAVIVNGVDIHRYGPRDRDAGLAREWGLTGRFVVGYVGTHGMAHGLGNVLEAADLLRGEADFRFLLVGDGAEKKALVAEARRRRLDNVIFKPLQPKEKMPAVWSLCDVALVHLKDRPLFADVIPSKIFEAMAMGLPILLAAPEGESSRIIADDKAGLWVRAERPVALAEACLKLMNDAETRRGYARQSLYAAPFHTRERQAELMIGALQMASTGRGGEAGNKERREAGNKERREAGDKERGEAGNTPGGEAGDKERAEASNKERRKASEIEPGEGP